jgi:hypothetical protein
MRSVRLSPNDTGRRAAGAVSPISLRLYWLISILSIALFVFLFANPPQQVAQEGATESLTVDGLDVGKQVTETITDLRATLGGVNNAATTEAALPRLPNTTAHGDKIRGLIEQLSAEQRKTLAGLVSPMMPKLSELFDEVLAIPGVADALKPTVEALKGDLATLAA